MTADAEKEAAAANFRMCNSSSTNALLCELINYFNFSEGFC